MRSFLLIGLLLTLSSCVKKEGEKKPESVSVTGAGSTNFGKIKLGEYRIAGIQIKNPTSSSLSFTVTGISAPFTIDGVSGNCSMVSVAPNSNCTIKIRFTPVLAVESFMTVTVLGQQIAFRGKGERPGELSLGLSSWNAGTFKAGEQRTLNIPVTNIGDTNLSIPIVLTPSFSIIAQNCGTEITPGESCQIVAAVQKAIAQDYVETLQFYTTETLTTHDMAFLASVVPNDPSGSIEFAPGPTQIIADFTSTVSISTLPIRDAFGNVVADGQTVVATPVNLNIDGSTSATTVNGIVSFTARASSTTGQSRIILSSNLASGVYNISSVSGPPVGNITLKSFNPDIRANGLATLTVETNPLLNISGNLVSDGTEVEVILDGPGTILTPVSERRTIGGTLKIQIKSTTTAGPGKITMRANPIYVGGVITGYNAHTLESPGVDHYPINFIPLDAIGNFDITSDHPSIYFTKNGSGRVDETTVRIVNIRDINNNPVGAGFTANVAISNGVHSITNFGTFSASTDALSSLTFPVKGLGVRDWITVDVTINGASKSHRIFAVGEQEINHNKGTTNKISLKEYRGDSRFAVTGLAPSSSAWRNVEVDYYGIRSLDNTNFGFKKSFGRWKEIAGPYRHLVWDCLIPVNSYLGTPPCEERSANTYRSYSIHETKTERTPETYINGNIPILPSHNSAFGAHILGPISAYDSIENKFHIFGGVAPSEVSVFVSGAWETRYSFDEVNFGITYGDISLMAYTPFAFASYDKDITFPVAPSYYRYKNQIFVFGGIKKALPGILAGNVVQHFIDGDLFNVTVNPGADGSPVGRYQNGVYFEEDTNELFIFGGRNANGDFLDEIWKTNMAATTKSWVKVCNLCGLPNNTLNNTADIISMLSTPVTFSAWQNIFQPMRPPVIIKDIHTKKTFYTMPYDAVLAEINFATGAVVADSLEEEYQEFRNFGHLVQHHTMDRFYRHDIVNAHTTDTKLYYKDGKKGQMVYYKAEITVDEEARLFAQDLNPIVSAYSANSTTRLASTLVEYGVQIYLWDYNTSRWVLAAESTHNSPTLLTTSANSMRPLITTSPSRFFSPVDNKVHVLIKPKHEIGYQLSSTPEVGTSELLINLIQLKGVF